MIQDVKTQFRKLSSAEKLQLVEELWDELASAPEELPVTEEVCRTLDAGAIAHAAAPETALTLEEFKLRLSARV